jgi:ubiquinone/menaquinone biosynthesis C-methylase UbiE
MTIEYINTELARENVYGHTKKIILIRAALDTLANRMGRELNVLDVGCGNGSAVTRYLSHTGGSVLGIDLHEPSINFAQENYGGKGINFSVSRAEDLSVKEMGFDAVIFADVLEHVEDPGILLRNVRKIISPNGRVYVTIPNGFGPFEFESMISRIPFLGPLLVKVTDVFVAILNKLIFPGIWDAVVKGEDVPYNEDSPHIQFFTIRKFNDLISVCGFTSVQQHNLSFLSGPFTNYIFAPSAGFCHWNTEIAAKLPGWMASAWFFELKLTDSGIT